MLSFLYSERQSISYGMLQNVNDQADFSGWNRMQKLAVGIRHKPETSAG